MGRLISINPETLYVQHDRTDGDLVTLATKLGDDVRLWLYRGVWNTTDQAPYTCTVGELRAWLREREICAVTGRDTLLEAGRTVSVQGDDGIIRAVEADEREPGDCDLSSDPTRGEAREMLDRLREEKYRS